MGPADLAVVKYKQRRDKSLAEASRRTRALCIGALILIWGLFSDKADVRLSPSPQLLHWLLGIALAAVVVLALDVAENLFGYQDSRKALGENVRPKQFRYNEAQTVCVRAKLLIGGSALFALCAVLFLMVLTTPARAASLTPQQNIPPGQWCGGIADKNEFICLKIDASADKIYYNAQGQQDWTDCTDSKIDGDHLHAICSGITFEGSLYRGTLQVTSTDLNGGQIERSLGRDDGA
jgi:hypothetical protein